MLPIVRLAATLNSVRFDRGVNAGIAVFTYDPLVVESFTSSSPVVEYVGRSKYKFCCVGIYCPQCTLKVEFLAFGKTLLVSDGLRSTCKDIVFTTSLEAVVQPGLYPLEVAYSFVNESAVMVTKKQVGEIRVKVACLQNLTFADGLQEWFQIGWKIGFFRKLHKGPYAYISEPVESRLESPILEWKPFHRVSGLCVRFSYLMPQIEGSSEIQLYHNSTTIQPRLLWKLSGYHGIEWLTASVPLDAEQDTKVEFLGVSSTNGSVAIAIDDIMITTENCTTSPAYAATDILNITTIMISITASSPKEEIPKRLRCI
ncbi:uncharacterized protein LOC116611741 [Nematostella vectensis]|uniref:uncharacterized protein LOC116611741 n=1 Tax=Nematostella vectensis TaxID=45351 RepID=UPI0020771C43|nr:uncharacterized protein LOC116611741 [Nematostella vectensis]